MNCVITVKELAEKYNLKVNFLRLILCRGEFVKYEVDKNKYHNCYGFIFALEHILKLKGLHKKCKLETQPVDVVNYSLN